MSPLAARQWPVWDLALLAFALVFTFESVVAAARCGMERRLAAAFAFPQNLVFLFENKSAFAGLIARLVLVNVIYILSISVLVQTWPWNAQLLGFDSYLDFIALLCVCAFVFLLQTMSSLHLIGQFASRAASCGRSSNTRRVAAKIRFKRRAIPDKVRAFRR